MAEVKFLYEDLSGYHFPATASDSTELGSIKLNGDLDMQSLGKVVNMLDGTLSQDGVTLKQLNDAVVIGGTFKEALLITAQTDDNESVLSAAAVVFEAQPVSGDTITITDGTTTRIYGAAAGGDVQFSIGGTITDTMTNFAAAVAGDGTGAWQATEFRQDFDSIDPNGAVILVEDSSAGALSRVFATWVTPADITHVNFNGEIEYTSKTLTQVPTSDPGSSNENFGFHRIEANATDGELHNILAEDIIRGWNASDGAWFTVAGAGSIPDATSASGGAVKGKLTMDSDFGLQLVGGVATVKLASSGAGVGGLQFDGSGEIEMDLDGTTLQLAAAGASVKGLPSLFEINAVSVGSTVTAANLDTITDGSDASLMHLHASVPKASHIDETYSAGTGGVTLADPVFVSANDTATTADAGTSSEAREVVGLAVTTQGAAANVEVRSKGVLLTALTGIPGGPAVAGDLIFLAAGGGLRIGKPGPGNFRMAAGIAKNAADLDIQITKIGNG